MQPSSLCLDMFRPASQHFFPVSDWVGSVTFQPDCSTTRWFHLSNKTVFRHGLWQIRVGTTVYLQILRYVFLMITMERECLYLGRCPNVHCFPCSSGVWGQQCVAKGAPVVSARSRPRNGGVESQRGCVTFTSQEIPRARAQLVATSARPCKTTAARNMCRVSSEVLILHLLLGKTKAALGEVLLYVLNITEL